MFGFLLLLFGLSVFFYSSIFFGIISFGIGLNLISTTGSQLDLENKAYRNITSIIGINIAKWKPTPEFDYISVFKTIEKQRFQVATAGTIITNTVILLNLFYDQNKHITFYKTEDLADAFDIANHLKIALNIKVLDATKSPYQWLT
jgi:hypothetical protein